MHVPGILSKLLLVVGGFLQLCMYIDKNYTKNKKNSKIILGCLPRALSLMSSAKQNLVKLTIIDEMKVLPLSRPHVPREDADLSYLLAWVARL